MFKSVLEQAHQGRKERGQKLREGERQRQRQRQRQEGRDRKKARARDRKKQRSERQRGAYNTRMFFFGQVLGLSDQLMQVSILLLPSYALTTQGPLLTYTLFPLSSYAFVPRCLVLTKEIFPYRPTHSLCAVWYAKKASYRDTYSPRRLLRAVQS
eukprot:1564744-Rhodomonas_salina.4